MQLQKFMKKILDVRRYSTTYVPLHPPMSNYDIDKLKHFIKSHKKDIVILTGAGISTESGLPDYRSKGVGLYDRSNHKPITYQEFMKSSKARKRYWARSFVGWFRFSSVPHNCVHETLAKLQKLGIVSWIITQNVDRLHFKAGSDRVIELHGTLYKVICTSCDSCPIDRHDFQTMLKNLNPAMQETTDILRPDGDVELTDNDVESFVLPSCLTCGGHLKPDVVFFGENVPPQRTELVKQIVDSGNSLLVLGSSLAVYSAYRIILQVVQAGKPVCIVNIGETRADHLATIKLNARGGEILPAAVKSLL